MSANQEDRQVGELSFDPELPAPISWTVATGKELKIRLTEEGGIWIRWSRVGDTLHFEVSQRLAEALRSL